MRLEQTTDPAQPSPANGHLSGSAHVPRETASARGSASERGQVVVLFALLIPVFFGLGALVLDIGNWYVHKRHLQTQVDAAAFAGAHEFFGCNPVFEDPPVTANKAIRAHALEYAGDTLRPPSSIDPLFTTITRNTQVQEPGDVRAALNSATWCGARRSDGRQHPRQHARPRQRPGHSRRSVHDEDARRQGDGR